MHTFGCSTVRLVSFSARDVEDLIRATAPDISVILTVAQRCCCASPSHAGNPCALRLPGPGRGFVQSRARVPTRRAGLEHTCEWCTTTFAHHTTLATELPAARARAASAPRRARGARAAAAPSSTTSRAPTAVHPALATGRTRGPSERLRADLLTPWDVALGGLGVEFTPTVGTRNPICRKQNAAQLGEPRASSALECGCHRADAGACQIIQKKKRKVLGQRLSWDAPSSASSCCIAGIGSSDSGTPSFCACVTCLAIFMASRSWFDCCFHFGFFPAAADDLDDPPPPPRPPPLRSEAEPELPLRPTNFAASVPATRAAFESKTLRCFNPPQTFSCLTNELSLKRRPHVRHGRSGSCGPSAYSSTNSSTPPLPPMLPLRPPPPPAVRPAAKPSSGYSLTPAMPPPLL
jgi:hypothetical protein